uniref:Uncharacterized protein n=1 Tax=viral metagenome TaxID=1070528 RepID=A0A6C0AF68_9ZZZZ
MNDKNIYELWSDLNIFEKSIKKNSILKNINLWKASLFIHKNNLRYNLL